MCHLPQKVSEVRLEPLRNARLSQYHSSPCRSLAKPTKWTNHHTAKSLAVTRLREALSMPLKRKSSFLLDFMITCLRDSDIPYIILLDCLANVDLLPCLGCHF